MTTLVIGARGSIGRHVLDQLTAAGEPVRASVRDLATAGDLPGGVPVVAADLTAPETLKAAFDGVDSVFVYALSEGAEGFAGAARDAGIKHVVLLSSGSVLLPWAVDNAIARDHRTVEDTLTASGLRVTPIRPLVLASNALSWSRSIRAGNVVRIALPDGVTSPIHERDIAAVAVAALTDPAAEGVSDLLTGSSALTQRQQVAAIATATGREIRIEELSVDEARAHFGHFVEPETAAAIVEFIVRAADGGSPTTDTARRVLGRPAVPFTEWAADHAADFD